jgi:hypothetical protein
MPLTPQYLFPDGTFFSGFADLSHSRQLLCDLNLDPWRAQRSRWWDPLGWMNVGVKAEDYAGVGEERRERLRLVSASASVSVSKPRPGGQDVDGN